MSGQGVETMKPGIARWLLGAGGALVLFAVVTGVMVAPFAFSLLPYIQSSGTRPTDAQMIAHWKQHRGAMEQIIAMLHEDGGLKRLGKDFADPDSLDAGGISPARAAAYRKLMREAGVLTILRFGQQIEFVFYTSGIYVSGGAKSFCFGPPPQLAEIVDGDLDAAAEGRRRFILQRKIEGDWWLEFESV